jgi:phage FluMu gp28-like protein
MVERASKLPRGVVRLFPWQQKGVTNPARFTHNRRSRQTGKTFELGLKADLRGLGIWQKRRPPHDQILLSASELQSVELIEKCRMHLQAMQVAFEFSDDQFFEETLFKRREIRLPTGKKIIGLAANPRTARGFTGDVGLDEFAMHQHDEEIWAALFPIVTRGDLCLDLYTTPKGKKNVFYRLETNAQFDHSLLTIYDAVEQGYQVDVEAIRAAIGDEDTFRQEYLCEYLDEATAYLTYELIQACEDALLQGVLETPEAVAEFLKTFQPQGELYVGMDVGRMRDISSIWLLERLDRVRWSRLIIELRKARFAVQRRVLWSLLSLPGFARGAIDATGIGLQLAEEATEQFGDRVEGVTFTVANKSMLATGLRTAVEDTCIRIPVDHRIRNAWHAIAKRTTSAGNLVFDAERTKDGHADEFWGAALANYAASESDRLGPAEFELGPMRRAASIGRVI